MSSKKYSKLDEENVMKKLWKENKDKDYNNVNWKRDTEKMKHLAEKIEKQNTNDELVKYVRAKKQAAKVTIAQQKITTTTLLTRNNKKHGSKRTSPTTSPRASVVVSKKSIRKELVDSKQEIKIGGKTFSYDPLFI